MTEPQTMNPDRAEVDTALPFGSVRAAVSLFGGQMNAKKSTFLEKRAAQDAELLHVQEKLLRLKELLEVSENERDKALQELAQAKEALGHANDGSPKSVHTKSTTKEGLSATACGQGLDDLKDKYSLWQLKLKHASEKHSVAVSEIESAKQQLTDLKQELLACSSENDAILKQTEEELITMEGSVKGAESLRTEFAGVNNWLSLLKHASLDVYNNERAGTKSTPNGSIAEVHAGSQGFELGNDLELKLLSMMNGSIRVREELKCAKNDESRAVSIAFELLAIVDAIMMEPKRERSFNKASLFAILEALKIQAENLQKDVIDLKEREVKAEAALDTLRLELENAKAELEVSRAEAKEQATQLSLALTQAEAEVGKGKTLIDSLREEISMTRSRTATVEAKSIISVSQLSQALKQSEADLAEARTEIAALLESAASIESLAQISQALKQAEIEMETMKADKQALQEELSRAHILNAAEDAKARECIEQLSQALKQVEAELEAASVEKKASQRENGLSQENMQRAITTDTRVDLGPSNTSQVFHGQKGVLAFEAQMRKLDSMIDLDEVESMKTSLKQALHRAEMAEARKSSAEVELRRLREREHRRKERALAYMTRQNVAKNPLMDMEQLPSSMPAKPHCEPLGNVLNINISAERTKTFVRIGSRRLKKAKTSNFSGILSSSSSSKKN